MHIAPSAFRLDPDASSDPGRVREAARELEAQFAQLLIQSMRATTSGDPLGGDDGTWRDMQDQQLAKALTGGRGLGLAPMIERQLQGGSGDGGRAAALHAGRAFSLEGYPRPPAARRPEAAAVPGDEASIREAAAQRLRRLEAAVVDTRPVGRLAALEAVFGGQDGPRAARTAAAAGSAAPAGAAVDASRFERGSPEAFVAKLWPHAQRVARQLGVCPKVVVAQSALETGWGRSTIRAGARDANNYFGIKTGRSWGGPSVGADTREVIDGRERREHARFRAYGSVAESVDDYAALLKNSARYADVVGQSDTRRFASALQRAGYATDPQYAAKLTAIAEGPTLQRALAALGTAPPRG